VVREIRPDKFEAMRSGHAACARDGDGAVLKSDELSVGERIIFIFLARPKASANRHAKAGVLRKLMLGLRWRKNSDAIRGTDSNRVLWISDRIRYGGFW
jgi:hypothetical protein